MEEKWKIVKGFPKYMVSDHGRIWHMKLNKYRNSSLNKSGYAQVTLTSTTCKRVNRLVYDHFGEHSYETYPYPEYVVDHLDRNPLNNHISNLRLITERKFMINV